jgi:hypothetical protein
LIVSSALAVVPISAAASNAAPESNMRFIRSSLDVFDFNCR